ncbi:MAG: FtsW/RodA/SpoVE family cell cycle protein [Candidatus Calescibacterium sp.]|nr:FtsW/RodA/SpoVE family cell cycle protein [Candidatus Calescibacterium sp.]MDW8132163.1 FtsW/RodA/SpoVE family cell cycle protein [Candidatus Calescibacterium sp.]
MLNIIFFNLSILLLIIIGAVFVGSANNFDTKFYKHLLSIFVGLIAFVLISLRFIKIEKIVDYSVFFWLISIGILILNLFIGTTVNGSKSWIYIGNFSFQPAELTKLSLLFLFLWTMQKIRENTIFFAFSLIFSSITILPIFLQPDLGFSVLLFLTNLIMNYLIGINGFVVTVILLVTVFIGSIVIKPYQLERLITFMDPYRDPLGSGWQTIQSVNCIINGGLWGQGIGNGMLSKLGFLPEKDTDFIFSLITEEVGLIGATLIIFLFIILILSIIWVYKNSELIQNKIISSYVFGIIFVQTFVNIAMNTMSGPITGLPLPLISYGGTNMVVTLCLLGIINQLNFEIYRSNKIKKWVE